MSSTGFQTKIKGTHQLETAYTTVRHPLTGLKEEILFKIKKNVNKTPGFLVLVSLESQSYSGPRCRFQTHSLPKPPGLSAAEEKISIGFMDASHGT